MVLIRPNGTGGLSSPLLAPLKEAGWLPTLKLKPVAGEIFLFLYSASKAFPLFPAEVLKRDSYNRFTFLKRVESKYAAQMLLYPTAGARVIFKERGGKRKERTMLSLNLGFSNSEYFSRHNDRVEVEQ